MPLTSNYDETFQLAGTCADWFAKCIHALERAGFDRIRADEQSFIIDADYRGLTVDGSIRVVLMQQSDQVEIEIRIIAAVDNVWAYLMPPLRRIRQAFCRYLPKEPRTK